jgi:phage gpG-like protein
MKIGLGLAGDALKRMDKAARIAKQRVEAAVRKASMRVVRQAKINVRQVLNTTGKSKGRLSGSITVTDVPGEPLARAIGTDVIYARIHEKGGVITPVHADKLVFPGRDGNLVFADSVTIPARPYLEPALDAVAPQIAQDFADELDYIFGMTGGGSE